LKQGPTEKQILDQARRSKTPIPQAILDKPELSVGLELYYMAFWDLMSDRSAGMNGAGMIHYVSMSKWMDDYGFTDRDERHRFKRVLHRLDINYLEYERGKS